MVKKKAKKAKKKTARTPAGTGTVAKPAAVRRSGRPTAVQVKGWALTYETMAACEEGERLSVSLNTLMRYKATQAAWERGQFLRKLAEAGRGNASIDEVEYDLQMAAGTLQPLLEKDDEAREQFNNARFATIAKIRQAIVKQVDDGKVTPTTLRQIETFLRMQVVQKNVDFDKVPTEVMMEVFGISRQTLLDWKKNRGMPGCSIDGTTYNLKACLQQTWREKADGGRERVPGWFERMVLDKATAQPGKFSQFPKNDAGVLQAEKARKLRMEIAVTEKRLVDSVSVEMGLGARAMREVTALERAFRELPGLLAGHSAEDIKEALDQVLAKFRTQAAQVPEDIADLMDERRAATLSAFLEEIVMDEVV